MNQPSSIVNFHLKNYEPFLTGQFKKKREFYLVVENISSDNLPQVKVRLLGPPQINIWTKSEWYGGIAKGKRKSRLFKVFPKENGIFNLTATLLYKHGQIATLPIELRVGAVQVPPQQIQMQQQTVKQVQGIPQKKETSLLNCPYCGEKIEPDARFCPICGSATKEAIHEKEMIKAKGKCPNCGAINPKEARFCGECGTTLQ